MLGPVKKKPVTIVIGVIVALILALVVGEIAVRMSASKMVTDEFQAMSEADGVNTEETLDVSFGASPLLLALVTNNVGTVNVEAPNTLEITDPAADNGQTEVRGTPSAQIHASNVDVSDRNNPIAESVTVTSQLPSDLILAEANLASRTGAGNDSILEQLASSATRMTSIQPDPERGVLMVEFSGGVVTAEITPVVRNGTVEVDVQGGSIAGFAADEAMRTMAQLAITGPIGDLDVEGLEISDVRVTENGIDVDLEGTNLSAEALTGIQFMTR